VLFIENRQNWSEKIGHRCNLQMLLILFFYIECVGTIHVNKFPLPETGASPGAANPVLFIENRQNWSEKKRHRCNLQMQLIRSLFTAYTGTTVENPRRNFN
jgi:hypothetical protein